MKRNHVPAEGKIHPRLTTYVGYGLHKIALRLRAKVDEKIADFGLVAPQYGMLLILKIEGTMTQAELAQYMAMDKATMVRMLDGLEEQTYVKRSPSASDRRAKLIEVTATGQRILGALEKRRVEAEREFLAPLSAEERTQLRQVVSKLIG